MCACASCSSRPTNIRWPRSRPGSIRPRCGELAEERRLRMDVDYTLDLHGVVKEMRSPVVVTLIDDDTVSVASAAPIIIAVADFGLAENIGKLEQAVGNITITPSTSVSFDFVFDRAAGDSGDVVAAVAKPETAALESSGNLTARRMRDPLRHAVEHPGGLLPHRQRRAAQRQRAAARHGDRHRQALPGPEHRDRRPYRRRRLGRRQPAAVRKAGRRRSPSS